MSEWPRRIVGLIAAGAACVALLACLAPPLGSQSLTETLRRRRDLAYDAWKEAERVRSVAVQRGRTERVDTLREGAVTLLVPTGRGEVAVRALTVMDSVLRRSTIVRGVMTPATYRLHRDWSVRLAADSTEDSTRVTWYLDAVRAGSPDSLAAHFRGPPDARSLAFSLVTHLRARVVAQLPPQLRQWLDTPVPDSTLPDLWSNAYVGLASSHTIVGRRCLVGDISGCRQALRLEVASDPLVDWLTPAARREIAFGVRGWLAEPRQRELRDSLSSTTAACFDDAEDRACLALLRRLAAGAADEPLQSKQGREALVVAALSMPRAPGLAAALSRPALDARQSLEAIGGAPLDRIVERWRTRVLEAKPERVVLAPPRMLSALAWVFVLGSLALGGSRWR